MLTLLVYAGLACCVGMQAHYAITASTHPARTIFCGAALGVSSAFLHAIVPMRYALLAVAVFWGVSALRGVLLRLQGLPFGVCAAFSLPIGLAVGLVTNAVLVLTVGGGVSA